MNFCFDTESSSSQRSQKDFVCSRAVRQKPSDSRSPWCPEGFQKLGNAVSVSYNRLPALNSNPKANRSCITSPFSCKASAALPALLSRAHQPQSHPADSLWQDTTHKEFPAKPPVSCRNKLFLCSPLIAGLSLP